MIVLTALAVLLATPTPSTSPTWDWPATSTAYWRGVFGTATAAMATALCASGSTCEPTTEPTPTLAPSATPTPRPYTPSGPTPTRLPRPTATWFEVTPRPTWTRMAPADLIATWTAAAGTARAALTPSAPPALDPTATAPSPGRAPARAWLPLALMPHVRQGDRR